MIEGAGQGSPDPALNDRAAVAERLRSQQAAIERELFDRIRALGDIADVKDPEYIHGLPLAIGAGVSYAIALVEGGVRQIPPVPAALLTQAHVSAHSGVRLDTVIHHYSASRTIIEAHLAGAVEATAPLDNAILGDLLRIQGMAFDQVIAAVVTQYRDAVARLAPADSRRLATVRAMLSGEAVDKDTLSYDFTRHHLAVIGHGTGAASVVKGLADALDCVRLTVKRDPETVWCWLGRRHRHDLRRVEDLVTTRWPATVNLAIGEPAQGLIGWRHTFRQAEAAFLLALRRPGSLIRYADAPLVTTALADDLLASSLHELFLRPLLDERDGGATLRRTLRAYFDAGRNGSSAAAALQVSRQTVANHLQIVEHRLGWPLSKCGGALEAALQLHELAVDS